MDKRLVKLLQSGKIGGGVRYMPSTPTISKHAKIFSVL